MDIEKYDHEKQLDIIANLFDDVRKYSNDTNANRGIIFSLLDRIQDEIVIIKCNI